jgi:RecC C-terminal domain
MPITLIFSNSLEELSLHLEKNLQGKADVVVPSSRLKQFLLQRIPSLISRKSRVLVLEEMLGIDHTALSLTIEAKLREDSDIWKGSLFASYLSPNDRALFAQRVSSLSEELARVAILSKLYYGDANRGCLKSFALQPFDVQMLQRQASMHFFGHTYIPPFILDVLARQDAMLYQWSPCMHFWEEGVDEIHPLLLCLGRLSRLFLKVLDTFPSITEEAYVAEEGTTALHLLQTEMLHLIQLSKPCDESIQVVATTSKWEEVEYVRATLEKAFREDASLTPDDVLILAPDISEYAPLIQIVFRESEISVHIEEMVPQRTFSLPEVSSDEEKPLLEWWHQVMQNAKIHGKGREEEQWCLERVKQWAESYPLQCFPFSTMERLLRSAFAERVASWSNHGKPSVCFTSFAPGCVVPKRLIWGLGCNDGHFPRREGLPSLFEGSRDAIPTKADEDKSLFLELIVAARDRLICSYVKSEEQGVSSPLLELIKHANIREQSLERALIKDEDQNSLFFVPCPTPKQSAFSLTVLKKSLSHPLAFYFQRVLGIYLKKEEESEFSLDALSRSLLCVRALSFPVKELIAEKRRCGEWPQGLFGDAQEKAILRECDTEQKYVTEWGIDRSEIFSVIFSQKCARAEQRENNEWVFPAIVEKDKQIIGKLEGCTRHGLLVHAHGTFPSFLAHLPLFFAYCRLKEQMSLEPQFLFLKDGKCVRVPYDHCLLNEIFTYVDLCLCGPSFFLPECASVLDNEEEYVKRWTRWEAGLGFGYEDPYLLWMQKNGIERNVRAWHRSHAKEVERWLQPVFSLWTSSIFL